MNKKCPFIFKKWSNNYCQHGLFNDKSSSVSNLIFVKPLPYLHSPSFMLSILFLMPSQSSLYFFNTSLFSSEESKTKYFFLLFFFDMFNYFTNLQIQRIYNMYIFMINFINCNIFNAVNTNFFVRLLSTFNKLE